MKENKDRVVNPDLYSYREISERANDLLMDAFTAGTTEVPNSVLLSHPEIFKRHRNLQMQGRRKEAEPSYGSIEGRSKTASFQVQTHQLTNEQHESSTRENLTSAPCGYINIMINNTMVKALWDSGAEVNVMQERKARQLGINITEGPTNIQGFDGTLSVTKGGARSVQVDIGGVNGLLYFVIVERANDEVVLGRPFEMAFQTTSAVLADGSYTGTVQNHDGTKRVSLSVLKGNTKRDGTLGLNTSSTHNETREGSTSFRVNPKFENLCSVPIDTPTLGVPQQPTFLGENTLQNISQKKNNTNNNISKNIDLEKRTLQKKSEEKEENKFIKRRQKIAHMLCNIMSSVEDEEQLEEIDEYLINPKKK
ncbi:hypothetical protein HMI54_012592 [Coelomomyces lativittatus]|nr:hypothetical protein HMI54_012592 [Coelomomyces lativittatus]